MEDSGTFHIPGADSDPGYSGAIDSVIKGRHYAYRDWFLTGIIKGENNQSLIRTLYPGDPSRFTRGIFWEIGPVGIGGFYSEGEQRIAENRVDGQIVSVEGFILIKRKGFGCHSCIYLIKMVG
jgi:hypothetical protein